MSLTNAMFDKALLSPAQQTQLPDAYAVRPLELADFHKGYAKCLSGLTAVGNLTEQLFADAFKRMQRSGDYYILVVEDTACQLIAAMGSLVVEQKLFRDCCCVGHLEDIVVAEDRRGLGLGRAVVEQLLHLARVTGCYRVVLDCDESTEAFYAKCGLQNKGIQMAALVSPPQ
ncbi:Glucosamine-phosphate N-acetyltransferase-like protein [Coemansia sp. Benny D115]|nr:Glucosamine-phosphate N-acetyltransferase-like protein [Coemansia sp. Benny D115]